MVRYLDDRKLYEEENRYELIMTNVLYDIKIYKMIHIYEFIVNTWSMLYMN